MLRYALYVFIGLIIMAPQEWMVHAFNEQPTTAFFMALFIFWFSGLTVMYWLSNVTTRLIRHKGLERTLSVLVYAFAGIAVEWLLLGNSPTGNPGANQLGLLMAWISVFTLPRMIVSKEYPKLTRAVLVWYALFVATMFVPVYVLGAPIVVGIILYGYAVVPAGLIALYYVILSWRTPVAARS